MLKEKCMILLIIDLSIDIRLCARWRKTLLFFPIQYMFSPHSTCRTANIQNWFAYEIYSVCTCIRFMSLPHIHRTWKLHLYRIRSTNTRGFFHAYSTVIRAERRHSTLKMKSSRRKEKISLLSLYLSIESITTSALPFCARKCLRMRAN